MHAHAWIVIKISTFVPLELRSATQKSWRGLGSEASEGEKERAKRARRRTWEAISIY